MLHSSMHEKSCEQYGERNERKTLFIVETGGPGDSDREERVPDRPGKPEAYRGPG